jgi:CRP-like cAMP-binding protein
VSIAVRGRQRLLARLAPGAVFGQVSLVDGGPRSATCTVQADALLAELDRDACRRLLADETPLALKLLAAINQGLIAELRDADRQRMRLEANESAPGEEAWT